MPAAGPSSSVPCCRALRLYAVRRQVAAAPASHLVSMGRTASQSAARHVGRQGRVAPSRRSISARDTVSTSAMRMEVMSSSCGGMACLLRKESEKRTKRAKNYNCEREHKEHTKSTRRAHNILLHNIYSSAGAGQARRPFPSPENLVPRSVDPSVY